MINLTYARDFNSIVDVIVIITIFIGDSIGIFVVIKGEGVTSRKAVVVLFDFNSVIGRKPSEATNGYCYKESSSSQNLP